MFTYDNCSCCFFILAILVVLQNSCFCMGSPGSSNDIDSDSAPNYLPAVATWYGSPNGAGSGGACGLANDVINPPYYGMISAGNNNLFKSGEGCGSCYKVKCTDHVSCSGRPIEVTITDECPGACNNDVVHFDLSGKAFGLLAKYGEGDKLRNAGRINIRYLRVKCRYRANINFKIDSGSNRYYLAFAVENVNGNGDIGQVEILPSNWRGSWLRMKQSWGATWAVGLPEQTKGPFSVRLTNHGFNQSVAAYKIIPADWAPGKYYYSTVNFPIH